VTEIDAAFTQTTCSSEEAFDNQTVWGGSDQKFPTLPVDRLISPEERHYERLEFLSSGCSCERCDLRAR